MLTLDVYRKLAAGMGMDVNELLARLDDDIAWGDSDEDEFWEELQTLRDSPETRTLLKATKGMTADDVRAMAEFAKKLRRNDN